MFAPFVLNVMASTQKTTFVHLQQVEIEQKEQYYLESQRLISLLR